MNIVLQFAFCNLEYRLHFPSEMLQLWQKSMAPFVNIMVQYEYIAVWSSGPLGLKILNATLFSQAACMDRLGKGGGRRGGRAKEECMGSRVGHAVQE